MSLDETELIERLHGVAASFEMPPAAPADDVRRGRGRVRRNRGRVVGAMTALVAVVLGAAVIVGPDREGSDDLDPVERPIVVAGDVPVWWDANGLHRGEIVERTPVELVEPERVVGPDQVAPQRGSLALVRSGAVYLDPATGDVWFHAWGGDPRKVGRDSGAGPGGDPKGDTAVWFEGSDESNAGPAELVLYDTAAGREISRTSQSHAVTDAGGDHYPAGNTFLQVSAERVVWRAGADVYSHDVRTQQTSLVEREPERSITDVHDDVEVSGALVVKMPGRAEENYPGLESHVRLSPSGKYVLAVEGTDTRHAAAILDLMTGDLWRVPKNAYPSIAWSYGDIALVDVEDELIACDAARRVCEALPAKRPFLMPTN